MNSRVTITARGKADIILAKQTLPLASEILVLVILPLSWHADEITVLVNVRYGRILFEGKGLLVKTYYTIYHHVMAARQLLLVLVALTRENCTAFHFTNL